jgi:hypothetical protein
VYFRNQESAIQIFNRFSNKKEELLCCFLFHVLSQDQIGNFTYQPSLFEIRVKQYFEKLIHISNGEGREYLTPYEIPDKIKNIGVVPFAKILFKLLERA